MKHAAFCILCATLSLLLISACAHNPRQLASDEPVAAADVASPPPVAAAPVAKPAADLDTPATDDPFHDDYADFDDDFDFGDDRKIHIADPIAPFNRAMFHFNDKMYYWVLKPVATGYQAVVPQPARISVRNLFDHLGYPARLVSCLLQTDFSGAAVETGRFAINTLWGIGGLMDPAAGKKLNLAKQDTDLGQTLGVYGVGHGFYIVWPVFGPSSPRDTVTNLGDQVLYPPAYLNPWYASWGLKAYEMVNATSLRIGDYEAFKGAAIDPYIAMRDAYIQYRHHAILARKEKSLLFKNSPDESQALRRKPFR